MNLDFNFYPAEHMDEIEGLLDIEVPAGWTVAQLIERLYTAKMMLLAELLHVDDDGNLSWW